MSDNSISDLFLADPLQLERSDFEKIVAHYRANRMSFNSAAKTTSSPTQTKKLQAAETSAKQLGINMDDIQI